MNNDERLLILSTIYENVKLNRNINDSYQVLLRFDKELPDKAVKFIDSFIKKYIDEVDEKYRVQKFDYLDLIIAIKENKNIELSYLKTIFVYPTLKDNLIDYIKSLMEQEIYRRLEENDTKENIINDIHPDLKGAFYGRK